MTNDRKKIDQQSVIAPACRLSGRSIDLPVREGFFADGRQRLKHVGKLFL